MVQNTKVVIVGAGHNGLVAAGYLARAGLNVQVLERRHVVGGAVVTEEWFPRLPHLNLLIRLPHPPEEGHRRPRDA